MYVQIVAATCHGHFYFVSLCGLPKSGWRRCKSSWLTFVRYVPTGDSDSWWEVLRNFASEKKYIAGSLVLGEINLFASLLSLQIQSHQPPIYYKIMQFAKTLYTLALSTNCELAKLKNLLLERLVGCQEPKSYRNKFCQQQLPILLKISVAASM